LLREAEGGRIDRGRTGRGGACREEALVGTEGASEVKKRRAGCWRGEQPSERTVVQGVGSCG
jgi:hypothetical protein